jgi:hypothetical protein
VTGAAAALLAGHGLADKGPGAVFGVAAALVLASAFALERCGAKDEDGVPGEVETGGPAEQNGGGDGS